MKSLIPLSMGQYYPADSVVHVLDPRVKICLIISLAVVIFAIQNLLGFLILFLFLAFVVFLGQLPWGWILRTLKPLRLIIIFTFAMHLLFTSGTILMKLGPLRITQEGLQMGVFICIRLILLLLGTSLLTLTTTPIELTDGLEYLLSPFRRLKIPAHELAMMMTIALRFIPTLVMETDKIMKAQMARGADFESGNILRRARSFLPLLIPLFVSAFRRADELALGMESRCYRGGEGRTRLKALEMSGKDWLAGMVALLLLIVSVTIGRL
ncbi:MAG: energy-coupling factor transporter transmembrane component T [Actinomycetota bacterium]|nr:energy-coupling factor transporter transmembrane component T [Actinomycetota bacterium]MDI6822386.1 energy-coupling factor transporter transmembrane component T [Actinomycetota bacterium]